MIKNGVRAGVLAAATVAALGCARRDVTTGRYQGMIELEEVDLGFEVGGKVATVAVRPGQEVAAGEELARLDDVLDRESRRIREREVAVAHAELALLEAGSRAEDVRAARAQLVAARATEATVKKDLERDTRLVASGTLPSAAIDETEARLARATGERAVTEERLRALSAGARVEELARAAARVAQAEQALALEEARLDKRILRAPVGGTVLDTYVEPGEVVAVGAPIATVIDRRRPYADIFVPVADTPRLAIGAPVAVTVEGAPGEVAGTVERVFSHAEFTPRFVYSPRERPNLMMRVRVRLLDPDRRLYAGLPAYARAGAPR